MRSDDKLSGDFRTSGDWLRDPVTGETRPEIDRLTHYVGPDYHRHPYSGSERNRLFLNTGKRASFADISGISGLDTAADSRSWCVLDFDRDGWQDVALVNANTPLLNLFRNGIGERSGTGPGDKAFLAVRLVGGNRSAASSTEFSNRDGVGAVVTVTAGDLRVRRVRRCGEGFAAQNSATLVIGLGATLSEASKRAPSIEIAWPSGRTQHLPSVEAGSLVTVHEDPEQSPTGSAFVIADYRGE